MLLMFAGLLFTWIHPVTRREVSFVVALSIAIASCGMVGSDYEPTDEVFRNRLGMFISKRAIDVAPIYGNADVDSLFGKYAVNAATPGEVLAEIADQATRDGWTLERQQATESELHKRTSGVGYEIVRVVCRGQQPVTVYVAWLQTDGATTANEARESGEGKWASRRFWPRFEREVASR